MKARRLEHRGGGGAGLKGEKGKGWLQSVLRETGAKPFVGSHKKGGLKGASEKASASSHPETRKKGANKIEGWRSFRVQKMSTRVTQRKEETNGAMGSG